MPKKPEVVELPATEESQQPLPDEQEAEPVVEEKQEPSVELEVEVEKLPSDLPFLTELREAVADFLRSRRPDLLAALDERIEDARIFG